MKLSPLLPALVISLLATLTQAVRLRKRSLQVNAGSPVTDESLLNGLLQLVLPLVNDAIKESAPDPLFTENRGMYNLGSFWIPLWCKSASFDFDFIVGEVVGLSDVYIDTMMVERGTGFVTCNVLNSKWSGNFSLSMATQSNLMANDLRGTLRASCDENGNERRLTIGGKMVAMEPSLGGQIDLAGNLCVTGYLTIDSASIPEPLSVGYSDIVISIDEQPTWIPSFLLESLASYLAEVYKEDLVAYVEPRMRRSIVESLMNTTAYAPYALFPYHLGFARNAADQRAASFLNGVSRFFRSDGGDDFDGDSQPLN